MRSLIALTVLFASTSCLTGCISSEIGMGVDVVAPRHGDVEVRPQLRTAINPFQLMPSQIHRDYDASLGVVTDIRHPFDDKENEAKSSVFVQGSKVVWQKDIQNDGLERVSAGAAARISWDKDHVMRPGLEPMVTTEIVTFSRENRDDSSGSVHTYGEMGVGLYLSGFFDAKAVGISAGLLARLPTGIMVPSKM